MEKSKGKFICVVCGNIKFRHSYNQKCCSTRCSQNKCNRNRKGLDIRDPKYILKLLLEYEALA